jgi:hypothetical protein
LGVEDVAVRIRRDSLPEAFVSTQRQSGLDPGHLRKAISFVLPGYSVPELYAVEKPFPREGNGQIDFTAIEEIIQAENCSNMSERALLVRDILANLLVADPTIITAESDFFLLGGTSLLLGKLSYFIRKESGVSVAIADIFTNSTVKGIASLIQAGDNYNLKGGLDTANKTQMYSARDPTESEYTLCDDNDTEDPMDLSRGQTHPLSLVIQAIPIIFFYPLKAAYICK